MEGNEGSIKKEGILLAALLGWGGDGSALPMQWTDGNLPNALMLPAYAVVVYIAER